RRTGVTLLTARTLQAHRTSGADLALRTGGTGRTLPTSLTLRTGSARLAARASRTGGTLRPRFAGRAQRDFESPRAAVRTSVGHDDDVGAQLSGGQRHLDGRRAGREHAQSFEPAPHASHLDDGGITERLARENHR